MAVTTKDIEVIELGETRALFEVLSGRIWQQDKVDPSRLPTAEPPGTYRYREAVPQLQLSMTDACNMSCVYCSFRAREGLGGKPVNMSIASAAHGIRFFREQLGSGLRYARIDYGLAGEPLIRSNVHGTLLDIVRKEFDGTRAVFISAGTNTTNATMALRLDLVDGLGPPQDISCDGPAHVHDDMRPYVNGRGTYNDVASVVQRVLKNYPGLGVTAVLTAKHPDFVEIFRHLRDTMGFRSVYMKPVNLAPSVDYGLNKQTLPVFEQGYTKLVDHLLGRNDSDLLADLLALAPDDYFMRFVYRVKDRTRQTYRCGAGKSGVYLDTNGKLYACAHFIGKEGWQIGDINTGFDDKMLELFAGLQVDTREPCKSCWARYLCGGGCYYQAVLTNGDPRLPDEVKCDLVRHLSREAIRLCSTLAIERPDVLSALPAPYYIDNKYLKAAPESEYTPMATLGRESGMPSIELARPGRVEGGLIAEGASLRARLERRKDILEVQLSWERLQPTQVRVLLFDVEQTPFTFVDLSARRADIRGTVLRMVTGGEVELLVANPDPVTAIPFPKASWRSTTAASAVWGDDGVGATLALDELLGGFSGRKFGLNIHIDLLTGGTLSLARYEPFCIVAANGSGALFIRGGEYDPAPIIAGELSTHPAGKLEPLGRWPGLSPNVC